LRSFLFGFIVSSDSEGNSKVNVKKLIGYLPIETLAVVPDNKRYQVPEKNCVESDRDSSELGDDDNEKAGNFVSETVSNVM
jgi:hypothetical protein